MFRAPLGISRVTLASCALVCAWGVCDALTKKSEGVQRTRVRVGDVLIKGNSEGLDQIILHNLVRWGHSVWYWEDENDMPSETHPHGARPKCVCESSSLKPRGWWWVWLVYVQDSRYCAAQRGAPDTSDTVRLKTQDPTRIKGLGEVAILSLDKELQNIFLFLWYCIAWKGLLIVTLHHPLFSIRWATEIYIELQYCLTVCEHRCFQSARNEISPKKGVDFEIVEACWRATWWIPCCTHPWHTYYSMSMYLKYLHTSMHGERASAKVGHPRGFTQGTFCLFI